MDAPGSCTANAVPTRCLAIQLPSSSRNEIFELRTKHGSNIVRCLYFYRKGKVIIVTNSFIKKTQKTPKSEIELALERKADYEKKH